MVDLTRRAVMLLVLACATAARGQEITVHSVSDISQEFTFYMDGRFHRQYLAEHGRDARNWGTLWKLDLTNVNLLILNGGNRRVPYAPRSMSHVQRYVREGGTLLLMADGSDPMPPGRSVARRFGAELTTTEAAMPLRGMGELAGVEIESRRVTVMELPRTFDALVVDAEDRPVLGVAPMGRGHVILASRGLFGQRPDASDPINADWVTPLLVSRAETKAIDTSIPHRSTRAELSEELEALTLEYHEGTKRFARDIHSVYREVRPHLVEITGVQPSPGMIKSLLILPTGGGGFSSGQRIAIGAWWGNYPDERYPMIELIAHEAGHSWVLPHPEPLWNEPIATYLGISTGRRMGFAEADETLERQIAKARRLDPELTEIDPLGEDAPRDLIWGKSYFVFEELERMHGPGAMAKYFTTKRRVIEADRDGYSMDDCVAVWSLAVGEDLFPWFRSLGFGVDRGGTDVVGP